jgi:hypothetical protein
MGGLEADRRSIRPPPSEIGSTISEDQALVPLGNHAAKGKETVEAALQVYNGIRDNMMTIEDTELMIKRLEKQADKGFQRSFVDGRPARDVVDGAPILKVGLSFLAGSDTAKVTRMEQTDMMTREPDQMSALWRVNTAGQILLEFQVSQDLSVITRDKTSEAAENARKRLSRRAALGFGSSPSPPLQSNTNQKEQITRKEHHNAVTIDSDEVRIVHDLHGRHREFDIESTLIEVDHRSMMNLLVRYHLLIQRTGPDLDAEETNNLLEIMMEDVRRLCHRSPVLFRMSTRKRIISSRNIRYGVNSGRQFTTLTTSQGIQEIIGYSAAYYNTLKDPLAQSFTRPRFLQMLVLLLSLLNDMDLSEIREFVEQTYKFKADRPSLELLLLKVLPLQSINPKVFLSSLVPAYEGYTPRSEPRNFDDFKHQWDTFAMSVQDKSYLIPGTVKRLGRSNLSWVVDWPSQGFKDSSILAHLQFADPYWETFNYVPRVESYRGDNDAKELMVLMTNTKNYRIRTVDYERIIRLTPNVYTIQSASENDRYLDMEVREIWLNQATREAVKEINSLIKTVNSFLAGPSLRRQSSIISRRLINRRGDNDISLMNECSYSGRLTKHVALLENDKLAIAYKLEGQKITLTDALSVMNQDNREIHGVVNYYASRLQRNPNRFDQNDVRLVREKLSRVSQLIETADATRRSIRDDPTLDDEPISKVIQPAGDRSLDVPKWYPYKTWASGHGHLSVDAQNSAVADVEWLSDEIVKVRLEGFPGHEFDLTPLESIERSKRVDQVREGDLAILAGHYMIIAERDDLDSGGYGAYCTNYLKIMSVTLPTESDRRRNRRGQGERGSGAPSSVVVLL